MNNKNTIIAILSSQNESLSSDQVKSLQQALEAEGYTKNSSLYPVPDGILGNLTAEDTVDFLKNNPGALLTLSPAVTQMLIGKGKGDEIKQILSDNQNVRQMMQAQAVEILQGKGVDNLDSATLKDFQTKSWLLGQYNGQIDGITGPKSRNAETSLRDQFTQAATQVPLPETRPEPVKLLQEIVTSPGSFSEQQPNTQGEININAYMRALEWEENGLRRGDGGEGNWGNKKDPQVRNMQVLLNRAGAKLVIDGRYGPGSEKAVKEFQADHGLQVTGRADNETLKTLASLPSSKPALTGQGDPKMYTVLEQRKIISDLLNKIESDTGVSAGYMRAVWGKETHFGVDMKSGTGSEGPYQFTGGTFKLVINRHGEAIASHLKEIGQNDLAQSVLESQAGRVDKDLRFDPYVASYAMAYLTKDNGIDTTLKSNWGQAFAAHNMGLGGLQQLWRHRNTPNVANVIGRNAHLNPFFYRDGATGAKALARYQGAMETWYNEYDNAVAPGLNDLERALQSQEPDQAFEISGLGPEKIPAFSAGKPS